ncbi:MAG: hypothetical protein WD873_02160 [Candidatus Hydrogenedentales bacterium]
MHVCFRLPYLVAAVVCVSATALEPPVRVGEFPQERSRSFRTTNGLPSDDIRHVAVLEDGRVVAVTAAGVAVYEGGQWETTDEFSVDDAIFGGAINATEAGLNEIAGGTADISVVVAQEDRVLAGAASGLFLRDESGWQKLYPHDATRSWAPRDVRAVAFGPNDEIWFGSPQGVGVLRDDGWHLYTGAEGLPWNEFTGMDVGPDGRAWFATTKGAIHFDGEHFAYRQGKRWLPSDDVRAVAAAPDGSAWFATDAGVGHVYFEPMTLAEKAAHYEHLIDQYHRRTEYGFVLEVGLPEPGVVENVRQHDSDNDGLWTAMYGAGECFAYAATGDKQFKERADKAFAALEILGKVTQGGSHPAPPGYVARTVLPTSGPDPNEGRLEHDRREKEGDDLWKIIDPRWPTSEDGAWYWKSDTSSDELDGHYFFYALYYDLVAETPEEKERVQKQVAALTDHLVEHNFNLVDHDGLPTRWARYSPEELNFDRDWWVERGLNSLSILSYLITAEHVTGDEKYGQAAQRLIEEHGYAQNMLVPEIQRGVGSGNQSDDEMAFMNFYNLLKYTDDADLRERGCLGWWQMWRLEIPELNPFFNFAFASQCGDAVFRDAWGPQPVGVSGDWLGDSVETLKRFPLDRIDWRHENAHRLDIERLPEWIVGFDKRESGDRGMRTNHRAIPVDERHFNHWNTDPFDLTTGGNGRGMADGAVFLLPYYMGLYHGFVAE